MAPVVVVDPTEAELAKLCSNALLSAKVAMANELYEICDRYRVKWGRVQAVVGLDRRIGPDHLEVTKERGFGGVCLPKDMDGLVGAALRAGYMPTVLTEIASFNRRIRLEAQLSLRAHVPVDPSGAQTNGNNHEGNTSNGVAAHGAATNGAATNGANHSNGGRGKQSSRPQPDQRSHAHSNGGPASRGRR